MVARLEKTQYGYAVPLTVEMVESLRLYEGAAVEVLPVPNLVDEPQAQKRYATIEEVLQAFEDTLPQHEEAYRELAK